MTAIAFERASTLVFAFSKSFESRKIRQHGFNETVIAQSCTNL